MKIKILNIVALILLSLTSVFAQQAAKVGDTAPDFALTDQDGKQIKLSQAVKKSNVVLVFYRGYW